MRGYKAFCYRWKFPEKERLRIGQSGIIIGMTPAPGNTYSCETWPPRGRGRGESLLSTRGMKAKLRAVEAAKMRSAGSSWKQIAAALGYRDASARGVRFVGSSIMWNGDGQSMSIRFERDKKGP